jgi:hypothetical protein
VKREDRPTALKKWPIGESRGFKPTQVNERELKALRE